MREPINGCSVRDLPKYGIVQINASDCVRKTRVTMSKVLLRVILFEQCGGAREDGSSDGHDAWYAPPDEVLRTVRDYSGDVQELAHIWSFAMNFNALAHVRLPRKASLPADLKGVKPDPVTMAALRPGAVLLEPEGTSLLTEELRVEREEGAKAPKPESLMRVVTPLRKKNDGTIEIEDHRVALHDIVNQERFTAGLTIAGSKGIDAWARVGEDKVVLFQTKGQQKGSAVGQPGNSAVLTPKELYDCIASLMISAYASADNHVKHNIRASLDDAESEEKRAELVSCECVCVSVCVFVCILSPSHSSLASWFSPASTCLPCIARLRASRHGSSGTRPRSWPSCWWCPSPAQRPRRNCPAASGTTSCMPSRGSGAKQMKHCWLSCARSRVTVTKSSAMQCLR